MYCATRRLSTPNWAARRAAAVVEFALLAPFITTLMLGMIEIGHAVMVKETLSNAVQKGCRTGAQPGASTAQVQADVDNIMNTDNGLSGYTTSILLNGVNTDVSAGVLNDQISVKVTIPVSSFVWTTSFFLPTTDFESETVVMLRQG
jgi:Flp pilus assembly protein TadG